MSIIRTAVVAQITTNPFHICTHLLRHRLLSVTALKSLFLFVHMVVASFPSCSAGGNRLIIARLEVAPLGRDNVVAYKN